MEYPNPNIPLQPPAEWFTPPADMPTDAGCIVEANGRIYGYICHFGAVLMGGQTDKWTPPRSKTQYAFAHTGDTVCADGSVIKTANLGGDAGHASVSLSDPDRLSKLQDYYENTSTQLARVRYGEDANGVWFAGACWPTVTDIDIAKLRASARSGHWAAIGDWRDMHSGRAGYELVGACLVNVPGLKYARADKAASGVMMLSPFNEGLDMTVTEFGATKYSDMPVLDDREHAWDASAADQRVRELTQATDAPNDAYSHAFFWFDGDNPDVFGSYKLQFADVVDGKLVAVPRGIFAVAAVLQGGRGGVTGISDTDIETIKTNVSKYYEKMSKQFDDPSIVAPWNDKVASSGTVEFASESGVQVGGVLVIEGQQTEDGRFIEAGAISHRELPLPLYAKLPNTGGHDDAQLVGTIDTISDDAADPKIKRYTGTVYPDYSEGYGAKTLQAIADKAMRGISVDGIAGPDDGYIDENDLWHMTKLVIGGGTLTPMPAFADATVEIGDGTAEEADAANLSAGATVSLTAEGDQVDEQLQQGDTADTGDGATATDGADVATPASADQVTAVSDKIDALTDAVAHLTQLFESSQMSARLAALAAREIRISTREKELGLD